MLRRPTSLPENKQNSCRGTKEYPKDNPNFRHSIKTSMASHYGSNDGIDVSRNRSTVSRSSETPTHQDDAEVKKARKREQDRLCQRRKREKDRENLRRLEARLNGLQNPDEPKVVLDLILRHEQDQERLNRQAERLRQIESLIQTSLSDIGSQLAASSTPNDSVVDAKSDAKEMAALPMAPAPATEVPMYTTVQSAPMPTSTTTSMVMPINDPALLASQYPMTIPLNMSQHQQHLQPVMPPTPPENHDISKITNAMSAVPGLAAAYTEESFDQHIIVMVLIHGWDAVAAYMQLDPLWGLLRQIDGGACSQWRKVDRMVGMLCFRRMMKGFATGPQAMAATIEPKWMRPRPSQLHVPHIPNGDYFPWPGVRERFVFEGPNYDNDHFLKLFNSSTRFMWNSDFSTTFVQNDKQLFQFSDDLIRRFENLNCWRIDASFIAAYPEFAGDIPTYNSVPKKIDDKSYGEDYIFGDDLDYSAVHNVNGTAVTAGGQWIYDNGRWYIAGAVR